MLNCNKANNFKDDLRFSLAKAKEPRANPARKAVKIVEAEYTVEPKISCNCLVQTISYTNVVKPVKKKNTKSNFLLITHHHAHIVSAKWRVKLRYNNNFNSEAFINT